MSALVHHFERSSPNHENLAVMLREAVSTNYNDDSQFLKGQQALINELDKFTQPSDTTL